MKVKNLWINEWCSTCKKAKGYSFTLTIGDTQEEEGMQEVPETCKCALFAAQCITPWYVPQTVSTVFHFPWMG